MQHLKRIQGLHVKSFFQEWEVTDDCLTFESQRTPSSPSWRALFLSCVCSCRLTEGTWIRSLPLHLSCTRDPSRQDCGGTRTRGNLLLPCCCDLASTTAGSVLVPRRAVAETAAGARCLQDEQAAPDARILPPTLRARAADNILGAVIRIAVFVEKLCVFCFSLSAVPAKCPFLSFLRRTKSDFFY